MLKRRTAKIATRERTRDRNILDLRSAGVAPAAPLIFEETGRPGGSFQQLIVSAVKRFTNRKQVYTCAGGKVKSASGFCWADSFLA
jgi:hypothetical protein